MELFLALGRRQYREASRALLDVLCPPHCPGCGVSAYGLCRSCRAGLETRSPPVCARCGEPLLSAQAPCLADHRPLRGLALARAPLRYAGTGGQLVRRMKFAGDDAAAAWLGRAMADALRGWAGGPGRRAVVVSVPLHRGRRRRRGFDQAAILAEGVAARLDLRLVPRAMVRLRATLPQGDPRVTDREGNVEGAFAVRRPRAVRGRGAVLVDDVTTSGATARACARALAAAGATRVVLLTAVRARA